MTEPRPIFDEQMAVLNTALIEATIRDDESYPLAQLHQCTIPNAIRTFFRTEVQQWLKEEQAQRPLSKRFGAAVPEIASLQQQIDMLLVNRFVFDRDDFLSTLDKAIHFYFNYLLRPEWTLINFLFDRKSTESVQEIMFKLNYCSEYLYYNEILDQYFTQKGLVNIRVDEFRLMLQKIDDRVVQSHNSIELARLTTPIFDFINYGKTTHKDEVVIDALIVFFDDKRLDAIRARLEKEKMLGGLAEISVWQLATIIEKVRSGNEDAVIQAEPAPVEETAEEPAPAPQSETPAAAATPEQPAFAPSDIPGGAPSGDPKTDVPKPVKVFDENGVIEKPAKKQLPDLRRLIDPAEQKRLVKKIFNKNEVDYASAILKLNSMSTWKEAAACLDEIFITNDIDPDSKDAVRFADLVYQRYPK